MTHVLIRMNGEFYNAEATGLAASKTAEIYFNNGTTKWYRLVHAIDIADLDRKLFRETTRALGATKYVDDKLFTQYRDYHYDDYHYDLTRQLRRALRRSKARKGGFVAALARKYDKPGKEAPPEQIQITDEIEVVKGGRRHWATTTVEPFVATDGQEYRGFPPLKLFTPVSFLHSKFVAGDKERCIRPLDTTADVYVADYRKFPHTLGSLESRFNLTEICIEWDGLEGDWKNLSPFERVYYIFEGARTVLHGPGRRNALEGGEPISEEEARKSGLPIYRV